MQECNNISEARRPFRKGRVTQRIKTVDLDLGEEGEGCKINLKSTRKSKFATNKDVAAVGVVVVVGLDEV